MTLKVIFFPRKLRHKLSRAAAILIALQSVALAQQGGSLERTEAQPAAIVLPVLYQELHLFVQVTDTKLGPLRLLLDTGFEHTSIDAVVASRGPASRPSKAKVVRGTGAKDERVTGELALELHAGPAPIFTGSADVIDLRRIGEQMRQHIDGVLGWDFFQQWCLRLDYSHPQVTLTPLAGCKAPAAAHGVLTGQWLKEGFLVPAHLIFSPTQSAEALLHLDTGSDAPFTLNSQFHKYAKGKESLLPQVTHGIGGDSTADLVELSGADLDHGQLTLSNGPVVAFIERKGGINAGHWWTVGRTEARLNHDGMIGNALLQKLTLTFDPTRKILYTEAASAAPQP